MGKRSAEEVGTIIRARRESLGLRQEGIDGVSSSTVGIIERGAPRAGSQRGLTLASLFRALHWPPDAYDRLLAGADPATFDAPTEREIQVDASSADLDALRLADPEAYEQIMGLARIALDRANARR